MNQSPVVAKCNDGSSITVYPQGAHLTSWRNRDGEELLYTSPSAVYKDGVAIRGGVPIIFPQFGNLGPLPAHGFARVRQWTLKHAGNGTASFTLDVKTSELQSDGSPFKAESKMPASASSSTVALLYTITFSNDRLQLQMEITNKDPSESTDFTFAFHTYFAISDVQNALVNGVNMTSYVDNLAGNRTILPPQQLWNFAKETDRVYVNQSCAVLLLDMAKKRTTHISGENLPDVVVWNPWVEKSARLKDLPPDGYKHFACVEHGAIIKKVVLPPHGVWKAVQHIVQLPCSKL
ncbi:aldose 1-epimerase-like protein [Trypanosoma grayi]|uniref:aldose 1-epimerase-like protein n=1 Tax=Trypanosoma grayi TaxID=71804 RepID=UPI0004F48B9E|nr:aldose 1-epimerase-like protein [Trypanosoma grayi]KEG15320.1 aldose 1-epimerase-like protein [Trypanosoma grayi]